MKRWPKCIACGRKLPEDNAQCCSHECELLWDIYFNWRAYHEPSDRIEIPKFPFLRIVHDVHERD